MTSTLELTGQLLALAVGNWSGLERSSLIDFAEGGVGSADGAWLFAAAGAGCEPATDPQAKSIPRPRTRTPQRVALRSATKELFSPDGVQRKCAATTPVNFRAIHLGYRREMRGFSTTPVRRT